MGASGRDSRAHLTGRLCAGEHLPPPQARQLADAFTRCLNRHVPWASLRARCEDGTDGSTEAGNH
jgi:hypothetical protein